MWLLVTSHPCDDCDGAGWQADPILIPGLGSEWFPLKSEETAQSLVGLLIMFRSVGKSPVPAHSQENTPMRVEGLEPGTLTLRTLRGRQYALGWEARNNIEVRILEDQEA